MKLAVSDLSFAFDERQILDQLNFTAEGGELIAVLGRNGAGKSTLFRLILGLLKHQEGQILIDNQDLRHLSVRELAQRVAYVPQVRTSTFRFRVKEVVLMGTTSSFNALQMPTDQAKQSAAQAMASVGISDFAERYYHELSGGEQQLVLIARALAQQAPVLVLDEPTAALDFGNQVRVLEIARSLAREGYLLLLSTHNPQHALQFADRVLLLDQGRLRGDGVPAEVLGEEILSEVYDTAVALSRTNNGTYAIMPALAGPFRNDPWSLYRELVADVPIDEFVTAIHRGDNWVAVETEAGYGLAMAQPWPSDSPRLQLVPGSSLHDIAELVYSFDLAEASLGLAAINCWYNRESVLKAKGYGHPAGMYATEGFNLKGRRIAMVGHLRHPEGLFDEAAELRIFERNPQPGDLPDTAEEMMLPGVDLALVTGSTLSNKSLPRVLELLSTAEVILTGPSVPMTEKLFAYGINRLCGLVVTDRDAMTRQIESGVAGPPYANGLGFCLDRETLPTKQ